MARRARSVALALPLAGAPPGPPAPLRAAAPPEPLPLLPPWPATWLVNASTIAMLCNFSGYMPDPPPYGLASFDWSNALDAWSAATPMDTEERLLVQAGMAKAANPTQRVFIYRNTAYGYPWYSTVRFILDDPEYSPWFLKFSGRPPYYSPPCDDNSSPPLCTDYFHTQMDTPNIPGKNGYGTCSPPACNCGSKPCGFYVFNHSSTAVVHGQSFQQWFVNSYMLDAAGLSPSVDGFFWDDYFALDGDMGDNTANATIDMGLTPADLASLTASYTANMAALANATIAAQRFAWGLLYNGDTLTVGQAAPSPLVAQQSCARDLRRWCNASSATQSRAILYGLSEPSPTFGGPSFPVDLANFLLVRGPFAYFGVGWSECSNDWRFPGALNVDVGVPDTSAGAGLCEETAPGSGVFQRNFTNAVVTTDCGGWTSSICPRDGGPCLSDFVTITTYFLKIGDAQWDHAPCADTSRSCSVYTLEYQYVAEFVEGACVAPGWAQSAGEPMVIVNDYW